MAGKRKYKSSAFEAIHSTVRGMYRSGVIDKATMRHFDESCLSVPAPIEPQQIKKIRLKNKVSQPVLCTLPQYQRIDGGEVGERG